MDDSYHSLIALVPQWQVYYHSTSSKTLQEECEVVCWIIAKTNFL